MKDGQRDGVPPYRTDRKTEYPPTGRTEGRNIPLAKGRTERLSTRLQDRQKDRVSVYRTDRGTEYPLS